MNLHDIINEWVGKLSQEEYEFLKELDVLDLIEDECVN